MIYSSNLNEVQEILSNLVAEQQLLDQYLQSIPVRNWNTKTTYKNWNITAHVSYLAGLEDLAHNALKKKGSDFNKYRGPKGLAKSSPGKKITWWKNEIDCRTFAVTKLSETWAHSLDVYDAMKKDYEDTVRIEHVALFGWLNAEQASKVNKIKNQDLRIELIGPEYKAWQFGNEQSENSIKGNAGDWCRVVTGRVPKGHKLTLSTEGDFAKKFVKLNHVKI